MPISDAEEVKEIISVVSTEIPKLLNAISQTLFSPDTTGQYAKSVADFYKSLKEAGMEDQQAYELTKEFMDKTNFAAMIQDMLGSRGTGRKGGKTPDVASVREAVEERVRERIRKNRGEKESESGEDE